MRSTSTPEDDDSLFTRTIGYGQIKLEGYKSGDDYLRTDVYFADAYNRYYEDSHSRDSKLSVLSVCVPNYYLPGTVHAGVEANGTADPQATAWEVGGSTAYENTWKSTDGSVTVQWPLRGASVSKQDEAFLSNQDLCFSNNVSNLGATDNRIVYSAGKFQPKHMFSSMR